jgi:hypothetical protein
MCNCSSWSAMILRLLLLLLLLLLLPPCTGKHPTG